MTTTNTAAQSALGGSGFISGHDSGAPMTAGNRLGFSLFSGAYDTLHSMGNSVGFAGFATETYNAGAMGGKFVIYTTPNGTTNRQIVATFDQD